MTCPSPIEMARNAFSLSIAVARAWIWLLAPSRIGESLALGFLALLAVKFGVEFVGLEKDDRAALGVIPGNAALDGHNGAKRGLIYVKPRGAIGDVGVCDSERAAGCDRRHLRFPFSGNRTHARPWSISHPYDVHCLL